MNRIKVLSFCASLLIGSGTAQAQAGSLDLTFDPGQGADSTIHAVVLQPDGKILIAGDFTSYAGAARNHIARLNADGSLDTTFDPGTGTNDDGDHSPTGGYPIALQADGKILVGGDFTSYDGTARNRIARLNTDGSLDLSFDPGTGADNRVDAIAIQADGKIIVGGWFSSYKGTARARLARLDPNGDLDPSYDPGMWLVDGGIHALALQADGKVVAGGMFAVAGGAGSCVARFNTDGSLDDGFAANFPIAYAIAIQPDGKILAGGGGNVGALYRFNTNGSADATFNATSLFTPADTHVFTVVTQADGKVLVGGHFHRWGTDPIAYPHHFARLLTDGSTDATFFNAISGPYGPLSDGPHFVHAIALQPDGRILIGGAFTGYDGVGRNRTARVLGDEVFDCEGVLGGPALPGTPCDDGCLLNGTEAWDPSCLCAGEALTGLVELTPFDTLCPGGDPYPLAHAAPAGGTWSGTGVSGNQFQASVIFGAETTELAYAVSDPNTGCVLTATQPITWMIPQVSSEEGLLTDNCGYDPLQLLALPAGVPGTWGSPADANGVLDRSCAARPFTVTPSVYIMHAANGDCTFDTPAPPPEDVVNFRSCAPAAAAGSDIITSACTSEIDPNQMPTGSYQHSQSSPEYWYEAFTSGCDSTYWEGGGSSYFATQYCLFYPERHLPGLYPIVMTAYGNWSCGGGADTMMITVEPPPTHVSPRIVLEGPYDPATGLMSDALRTQGLIPLAEPYSALGLPVSGPTTTTPEVLTVAGNGAIVDWAVVELRATGNSATVLERRAVLLTRSGNLTALDGASPVGFCTEPGSYHVAVRHRNHLGVMTSGPIGLGSSSTVIDLTSVAQGTFGTNARKSIGGVHPAQVLWAGDASGNGQVKYTGSANDRDLILTTVGSTTPNATVSGTYSIRDVNMNGQVKYTGSANDRDPILLNVGSTTPNNTRSQQLP